MKSYRLYIASFVLLSLTWTYICWRCIMQSGAPRFSNDVLFAGGIAIFYAGSAVCEYQRFRLLSTLTPKYEPAEKSN